MKDYAKTKEAMHSIGSSILLESCISHLDGNLAKLPLYLNKGLEAVWLVRAHGTVLIPLGVGADPVLATHWLWSNYSQNMSAYHITSYGVEMIDFEQAERLVSREPYMLSALLNSNEVSKAVNDVLSLGVELGVWECLSNKLDLESNPSLAAWQLFFATSGNKLMANFIGKAIRFMKIKPVGS